jgi:hypothetical protein
MMKPKLASNCRVKTAVCVRKPGPMADVAIKKAAAAMGDESFPGNFRNIRKKGLK